MKKPPVRMKRAGGKSGTLPDMSEGGTLDYIGVVGKLTPPR
jgi:hypothetical protein